jgi:hypothetical protein
MKTQGYSDAQHRNMMWRCFTYLIEDNDELESQAAREDEGNTQQQITRRTP